MKRKHFLLSILSIIAFGFIKKKSIYRKAYIYNDDGSKDLKEFGELKWADYFELVEPDGTLVNNGEVFLATSAPYMDKIGLVECIWIIDVYDGEDSKGKCKPYPRLESVSTRNQREIRLNLCKDIK